MDTKELKDKLNEGKNKVIPLTNYIACGLAVVLVAVVIACSGGSSKASPVSDFDYRITTDGLGVIIAEYIGKGGNVVIPAEIEGLPVVELRTGAFYGEDYSTYGPGYNITSVVIPASVKRIGNKCFSWIDNLKKVTIQGTGVVLESFVFEENKNLTELNIPDGDDVLIPSPGSILTSTGNGSAFVGCNALPSRTKTRLVAMGFRVP